VPHAGIGQAEGPATADAGDGIGHAEVEDENAVLRRTAAQEIPIDVVTGGAGDRLAQAGRRGRLAEPRVYTTVVEHRRSTWHCSAATCHSLPDQDKTLSDSSGNFCSSGRPLSGDGPCDGYGCVS
jgi:hypothetical protein